MKEGLYLSDLLQEKFDEGFQFPKGVFNVIDAPCGSGKTTAAIDKICVLSSIPCRALYLIDTTIGKDRLIKEGKLIGKYDYFELRDPVQWADWGEDADKKHKTVITTYAQFGVWAYYQGSKFTNRFEVIVCDEAHNLINFAKIQGDPGKSNYTEKAQNAICDIVRSGKTTVVGITATTENLTKLNVDRNNIDIDKSRLRQYEIKNRQEYASLDGLIERLPKDKRGILYVAHITEMEKLCSYAKELGFTPICIWSKSNEKHPMNEEQLRARQHIIDHEKIPPDYNLLIINASCETSINLRGDIDYIVIHSSDSDTITQVRGRYRANLNNLYTVNKSMFYPVPDKYIGKMLFKEDKDALRKSIAAKNDKGHYPKYDVVFAEIEKQGYKIINGRENNMRYIIIEKP